MADPDLRVVWESRGSQRDCVIQMRVYPVSPWMLSVHKSLEIKCANGAWLIRTFHMALNWIHIYSSSGRHASLVRFHKAEVKYTCCLGWKELYYLLYIYIYIYIFISTVNFWLVKDSLSGDMTDNGNFLQVKISFPSNNHIKIIFWRVLREGIWERQSRLGFSTILSWECQQWIAHQTDSLLMVFSLLTVVLFCPLL